MNFSQLCNSAIRNSMSEYVIICNDKARPDPSDIHKMIDLLDSKFGFVGMYRFGFFGFSTKLGIQLGGFDSRFKDGGYEDVDMLIKLKQNDIKVYMSEEIRYVENVPSTWRQQDSGSFFHKKYEFDVVNQIIIQRIPHEANFSRNRKLEGFRSGFRQSELCLIPFVHKSNNFSKVLLEFSMKLTSQND